MPEVLEIGGDTGLRLAASFAGDDKGPPVILLHGGGQTRHAWDATTLALAARGYRTLSFDARGHGDSEWAPDGGYSRDAMVADLVAVTRCFDRPAALVGASLGGNVAMIAVGEGLLEAWALVLVDVVPRLRQDGADRIIGFMTAQPAGFADVDEAVEFVAAYLPHRRRPADTSGLLKNLRVTENGRLRWHWDPRFLTAARVSRATETTRLVRAATGVRIPT